MVNKAFGLLHERSLKDNEELDYRRLSIVTTVYRFAKPYNVDMDPNTPPPSGIRLDSTSAEERSEIRGSTKKDITRFPSFRPILDSDVSDPGDNNVTFRRQRT